eukprot:8440539-Alexandrium_andersonii.AAC.1
MSKPGEKHDLSRAPFCAAEDMGCAADCCCRREPLGAPTQHTRINGRAGVLLSSANTAAEEHYAIRP